MGKEKVQVRSLTTEIDAKTPSIPASDAWSPVLRTAEARVRCSFTDHVSIGVCFSFSRCCTPVISSHMWILSRSERKEISHLTLKRITAVDDTHTRKRKVKICAKRLPRLGGEPLGVAGEHGGLPDVVQAQVQHRHSLQA